MARQVSGQPVVLPEFRNQVSAPQRAQNVDARQEIGVIEMCVCRAAPLRIIGGRARRWPRGSILAGCSATPHKPSRRAVVRF